MTQTCIRKVAVGMKRSQRIRESRHLVVSPQEERAGACTSSSVNGMNPSMGSSPFLASRYVPLVLISRRCPIGTSDISM